MSDFFERAEQSKVERTLALVAALTGRARTEPNEQSRPYSGFDGGARMTMPLPPETHDETLVRLIRERSADAGARF